VAKGIERILLNGLSKVNYKDKSTHTAVCRKVITCSNSTSIRLILYTGYMRLVISIAMVYFVVALFVCGPAVGAASSTIPSAPVSPTFTTASLQGSANQTLEATTMGRVGEGLQSPQNTFLGSPPLSFHNSESGQINQGYQTPLLGLGTNLQTFSTQSSEQRLPPTSNTHGSQPAPDFGSDSSMMTHVSPLDTSVTSEPNTPLLQPNLQQPNNPLQQSSSQLLTDPLLQPNLQQPNNPLQQSSSQLLTDPTVNENIASQYSGSILQQASVLPPLSTTFPPTLYPPVSTIQPFGNIPTGSTGYPYPYAPLGNTGATGATAGAVGKTSEIISPWFPSLPAMYCGGTFVLTIEGMPRGYDNKDAKIEPSDHHNYEDKDSKYQNSKDRRLLALQINSDNSRIFTDEDAIFGQIFQGKNNIDQNKGNDFDIKSIFNDCQVVTYSSD
jgi:hypothetical protein